MPFGAKDKQASKFFDFLAQFNVCSPTCHIGGNRHCTLLPSLGNNLSFPFMEFCIEYSMADICPLKHTTENF